jgi:hypothetical protein
MYGLLAKVSVPGFKLMIDGGDGPHLFAFNIIAHACTPNKLSNLASNCTLLSA